MGTCYGVNSRLITAADVNLLSFANGTVISQGDDSSGGFSVKFQFDTTGCGSFPDGWVSVELKDNPVWTNVSCEFYNSGQAACWDFNNGGSYGGNLTTFSSALDRVKYCANSFELPQFQTKMGACDNASTNFMHGTYMIGAYRSFFVQRRRASAATPGSIIAHRSCNASGANAYVIIRNIFVW